MHRVAHRQPVLTVVRHNSTVAEPLRKKVVLRRVPLQRLGDVLIRA